MDAPNWNRRRIDNLQPGRLFENKNAFPAHIRHNVVLRYIYDKVHHKGEDCLVAVCGPTGRGKTAVAGYLSELLDCTFNGTSLFPLMSKNMRGKFNPMEDTIKDIQFNDILPNVCYGMGQIRRFWKRMALLADKNERLTRGRSIIVEEAQNYLNSRSFRSSTNMEALRQLLTGREFGNIYFFTYPNFKRIDSQIKELIHLRINLGPKNTKENYFQFRAVLNADMEKYPNGVNFRSSRGKFHTYTMDKYTKCPPPSKELFRLLREKGRFWKNAMRKGQIDKDTGDYLTEEEANDLAQIANKKKKNYAPPVALSPSPPSKEGGAGAVSTKEELDSNELLAGLEEVNS